MIKYKNVQSLMQYVNVDALEKKYKELSGNKATDIVKVIKDDYDNNLKENIFDLLKRMKLFSYKSKPTRRVYIPKDNVRKRPLGIPSYEDKIV